MRRAPRRTAICRHFWDLIAGGELNPGDRLPTRVEIERAFSASPTTVQSALRQLSDDGFVVAAGRNGTFVSEAPPHLSRYVLSFPLPRTDPWFVRLWTVLSQVAQEWESHDGRRISIYTGVAPGNEGGDLPRLLEDVEARRLAGVIFGTDPWPLAGSPLMEAEWLPRVAFMSSPGRPGVAGVDLGGDGSFFERALDLLASRGRGRVGLITVPGISGEKLDGFRRGLAERDMTCEPRWIQTAHQSDPKWAAHLTLLMLSAPSSDRPDGLIIADDNLVEHACSGVVRAGVALPGELDIVAHCNFPTPVPSALPIHRLGYDIRRAFEICIDLLERQRRGKTVPRITSVPPVLESEIEGGAPALIMEMEPSQGT